MGRPKLLAVYSVNGDTFQIKGGVETEMGEDIDGNSYLYPEFSNIQAFKVEGLELVPFIPNTTSWLGRKYTPTDMAEELVKGLIRGDKNFQCSYLDESIKDIVDHFKSDTYIIFTDSKLRTHQYAKNFDSIKFSSFPSRILGGLSECFNFYLATSKYVYYIHYDEVLMLDVNTREIISDNYFASVGLEESINALKDLKSKEYYLQGSDAYAYDLEEMKGEI